MTNKSAEFLHRRSQHRMRNNAPIAIVYFVIHFNSLPDVSCFHFGLSFWYGIATEKGDKNTTCEFTEKSRVCKFPNWPIIITPYTLGPFNLALAVAKNVS